MITGQLVFYTIASRLLSAVEERLVDTPGGAVSRSCVVPAAIAWDECDCGMLVISVGDMYLSDNFPTPLSDSARSYCEAAWIVADITIQLIRCAPNPTDNSFSPPCSDLDASAQAVTADAWHLMDVVPCFLKEMEDSNDIVDSMIRRLVFQGPSGGCVGSELTVTVGTQRGNLT